MAVGAYLLLAAIIIGAIVGYMMAPDPPSDNMEPNTLDSFQVTQATEGAVVPILFGTKRIRGNILWYGNLETVELTDEAGKGGSEEYTTGYEYYMDLWQAICLGPEVELIAAYSQDKPFSLDDLGNYTLNPGNSNYYPTEPGEWATKLPGVAHIFLDRFFLGENAMMVPTIHWVMKYASPAPLTYANMTSGTNPAAMVYDLFIMAGATSTDFVLSTFQEAANYWYGKNYGLNMSFSKQQEVRNMVRSIFVYVDAVVRVDADDKIVLKALKPDDSSVASMVTDDFKEFEFHRRSWDDVHTDFRANFTDKDLDYTKRTLRVRNPAVHKLIGHDKQKTIDLTAFNDVEVASARLWEMMRVLSYPEAQIDCTVGIKFSNVHVGDVASITNTEYGLANADFRIIQKDDGDNESNEVKFKMTQMLAGLANDYYQTGAGSQWQTPDYSPSPFVHQRVFELPYNSETEHNPAYLLLGARENVETGFVSLISINGTDYQVNAFHRTFSQRGVLDETYNIADTYWFDDERGILFTPYKDDPVFTSLSRAELFNNRRCIIIGDEIIAFQTITPEGVSSFRLTGCIRGILNTPIQNHAVSAEVWLTNIGDSILTGVVATEFYVKMLPTFGAERILAADATPIHFTGENKAATPWKIGRIKAIRSGSNLSVTIWPTTKGYPGAGVRDMRYHTDVWPPSFDGSFEYKIGAGGSIVAEADTIWNYTQAGDHDLYVRQVISGFAGAWVYANVEAADATYVGPEL